MKITSEITLLHVALLFRIASGRSTAESSRCTFELHGSGYFAYPGGRRFGNSAIPSNFFGGQRESETCRIVYKLKKNWDVSLVLLSASGRTELHKHPRQLKSFRKDRTIFRRNNAVRVLGNETEYLMIKFPPSVVIVLRYTAIKARYPKCPRVGGLTVIQCSKGRKQGSKCTFLHRDYISNRHTKIFAKCSKNSTAELMWRIEKEVEAEGLEIAKTEEKGDYLANLTINYDMYHCNKFPDNIRAVSCSDATNLGSNCTLQCRDGFVPAPHLYKQKGNIFPQLWDRVPQFWAECTYDERYDILATWRPQVSTNGLEKFRNPKQLYLDCMKLEDATDLYFRLSSHYLDFFTARRFKSCPYDHEDVANFLLEQPDDYQQRKFNAASDIQTFNGSDDEVEVGSSYSKVILVPDEILVSLNDEEWKWVLHPTDPAPEGTTCEWDSSLHMALFQHPPVKGTGVLDLQKVREVVSELDNFVNKTCHPTKELKNWVGDCAEYCIWETANNRLKLCGEFDGKTNIRNCLVCKMKGECSRFNLLT